MVTQLPVRPLLSGNDGTITHRAHQPGSPFLRDWRYVFVLRAGAFERHIRACTTCGGTWDGKPVSGMCAVALHLAQRVDQAQEEVERLQAIMRSPDIPAGTLF